VIAVLLFVVVFGMLLRGRALTARLGSSGQPPPGWMPSVSFRGAVTLGRVRIDLPGSAILDASPTHVGIRPARFHWFTPVWLQRDAVSSVYAGSWWEKSKGGIRFRSDAGPTDRIGFWPNGVGTLGRDEVLAALRALDWPVDA
jgi:hypothetical protein